MGYRAGVLIDGSVALHIKRDLAVIVNVYLHFIIHTHFWGNIG